MMIALTPQQSRELAIRIRSLSPYDRAGFHYFTLVKEQDPYEYLESITETKKHQSGTHDQQSHGNWADGSDKYNALLQDLGYTQDSDIEGIRAGDIKAYAQTFNEFVDTDMTDITSYQQDGYRLINPYLRGTELDEDDYETINRRYLFSNSDEVSTEVVDLVRSNEVIQSEFQRWAQMNDLQLGAAMRAKEYKELLAQAIDEMDLRDVAVTIATDAKYIPKGFKKSIEQIDELIDKAPPVMGKTELFRVYNADALAGLEEGSVIRDKAFLSTTSRDLTSPNSQDLVNLLDSVTAYDGVTSRVTAVIEPNKKGDGKGFSFPHAEAAQTFFKTGDFNWVDLTVTEREVLLPRNTPLQFKGYGTRNDRRVAIFQRVD